MILNGSKYCVLLCVEKYLSFEENSYVFTRHVPVMSTLKKNLKLALNTSTPHKNKSIRSFLEINHTILDFIVLFVK